MWGIPLPSASFHASLSNAPLLQISGLDVGYSTNRERFLPALRGISLEVSAGETVGILGESGCGKSTLAGSILGLLPQNARVQGDIRFHGEEILGRNETYLRKIRGAKISLIHQEPSLALSPVMRVGGQIGEVLRAHGIKSKRERRARIEEILLAVHLTDIQRIAHAYPHELSGGELHRAAIAQAIVCRPQLLIADEPNRSLDVRLQLELLSLLRELNQTFGTALIFITHNPMLLAGFAERVVVMRMGEIVEAGRVTDIFRRPANAYTRQLLQHVPRSIFAIDQALHHSAGELLPS